MLFRSWVCSESGLPDDLSWGRLGYIRWLDTSQDRCHSKATHPLDHTDFTERSAGVHTCPGARRTRQAASCTGVRLNDGSMWSGAFELRVQHFLAIQDLGGTEAAMSRLLGSTHALELAAHVRRPHAPACA